MTNHPPTMPVDQTETEAQAPIPNLRVWSSLSDEQHRRVLRVLTRICCDMMATPSTQRKEVTRERG